MVHEGETEVGVHTEEKMAAGVLEEVQTGGHDEAGQTGADVHEGHICGDDNGAFPNDAAREKHGSNDVRYHASLPGAVLETCDAVFAEAA